MGNILHVNSYYAVSPFYRNLYAEQLKSGLNIKVYVPVANGGGQPSHDLGDYSDLAANYGKFDRVNFGVKHRKIFSHLVRHYSGQCFNAVHAHSLFSNGYLAYRYKQEYAVPYVVAVRNTDLNVFFKYMLHLRALGIRILMDASKVVFLSPSYLSAVTDGYIPKPLRSQLLEKSVVIPNGIDDFWLERRVLGKGPSGQEVNIVYAGVVDANKNCLTTLRACRLLAGEGHNVRFTVVGQVRNKHIHAQLMSDPLVTYHEPKTKEGLLALYERQSIFVMPSIHESFGLVYAEAMSQGLPVIYSRGQGFDGQFADGLVGHSVNPKDEHEIASVVKHIHANYFCYSKRAAEGAIEFRWKDIATRYRALYEGLK